MTHPFFTLSKISIGALALITSTSVLAANVKVNVKVENLAQLNSIAFAPLHVGFNNGTFDAFNIGDVANASIISVAEGGAGTAWQAAFGVADPNAVRGTISPGGPLLSGQMASASFVVDTDVNKFFTFGAMVIPSNDFFIGNDSPTEYHLFDDHGNLKISSITLKANEIWDAGSEVFDPLAAAFVGTNNLRTAQNSVVAFNFAELAGFDGLMTGAGYVFNSGLKFDSDIYRISFEVTAVPEPESYAMLFAGLAVLGVVSRKSKNQSV